jgi:hypothetical protein
MPPVPLGNPPPPSARRSLSWPSLPSQADQRSSRTPTRSGHGDTVDPGPGNSCAASAVNNSERVRAVSRCGGPLRRHRCPTAVGSAPLTQRAPRRLVKQPPGRSVGCLWGMRIGWAGVKAAILVVSAPVGAYLAPPRVAFHTNGDEPTPRSNRQQANRFETRYPVYRFGGIQQPIPAVKWQ